MKGGVRGAAPFILSLGARSTQVANFTPPSLYPTGRNSGPLTGGRLDPAPGLDVSGGRKICRGWNTG